MQQPLALSLPATFQTPGKHSCPKIEKIAVLFNSFVDAWIQLNVEVSLSKILRTKSTFCEILVADINLHFGFSLAGFSRSADWQQFTLMQEAAASTQLAGTRAATVHFQRRSVLSDIQQYIELRTLEYRRFLAWLQLELYDTKKMLHIAIVLTFFSLTEP